MNIIRCPQCGQRATSFLKKLSMHPLRNIPCRSCGIHLGIPWWSLILFPVLLTIYFHVLSSLFDMKTHPFILFFPYLVLTLVSYGLLIPLKRSYL
jgi:hypothetical protein